MVALTSSPLNAAAYAEAHGARQPNIPGVAPRAHEPRIVGGQVASISDVPWQVALVESREQGPLCGGSIIDSQWVLTAAHCVNYLAGNPLSVVSGTGDPEDPSAGTLTSVERVVIHPKFRMGSTEEEPMYYDVALLKLESPLVFTRKQKPIGLLRDPVETPFGREATISGWGSTSEDIGGVESRLQKTTVKVLAGPGQRTCENYDKSLYDSTVMLCAGIERVGGKDTCYGDSGGPLAVQVAGRWQLAGVTSWGYGCARPGWPGMYARVSSLVDWIERTKAAAPFTVNLRVLASAQVDPGQVCAQAWSQGRELLAADARACASAPTKTRRGRHVYVLPLELYKNGRYALKAEAESPYAGTSWWGPNGSASFWQGGSTTELRRTSSRKLTVGLLPAGAAQVRVLDDQFGPPVEGDTVCVLLLQRVSQGLGRGYSECALVGIDRLEFGKLSPGVYTLSGLVRSRDGTFEVPSQTIVVRKYRTSQAAVTLTRP